MEKKDFLYTVILTTTVFAALITSIANIIISLINSYRLKHIEEQKKLNEIDKYRYSRHYQALFLLGVVLFFITLIINFSVEYISSKGVKRSK